MLQRNRALILLLTIAIALAGCGVDDDSSETTAGRIDRTETTAAASETTAAPQTTSAPEPIAGDTRATTTTVATPTDTNFEDYGANPFEDPEDDALSTFAVDVDTGSYTLMRAWVNDGVLPDPNSVRVEEYVNYFDGGYPAPEDSTFAIYADGSPTPYWDTDNDILRIGIKAREVTERQRQDLNLTIVVDVSGSMRDQGKLDIVRDSLRILVDKLDRLDTISIVAYDSEAWVVLDPVDADDERALLDAIAELRPGGSTNAEAGLTLGYELADEAYDRDAINRVMLISDGVANVGSTGPGSILETIGDRTRRGIQLVTVGVGISTYNDVLLEQLADQGDGWYAYIDTVDEAERLFEDQLTTSFETVALDAKVQVEFDPYYVEEYRLIGFENRDIADDEFRDDRVDAGEINAGHTVTALYEVVLARDTYNSDEPFATVRLRWEDAETGDVEEIEGPIHGRLLAARFSDTAAEFQLVASVAAYAEILRESRWIRGYDLADLLEEVDELPWRELDDDADEFHDLLVKAVRIDR